MIGHLSAHLELRCPGCGGSLSVDVDLEKRVAEALSWQRGFVSAHEKCGAVAEKAAQAVGSGEVH